MKALRVPGSPDLVAGLARPANPAAAGMKAIAKTADIMMRAPESKRRAPLQPALLSSCGPSLHSLAAGRGRGFLVV